MDFRTLRALDQWLTTDPRDDDYECRDDYDGTGYTEHDFEDGAKCSRCGAESDEDE